MLKLKLAKFRAAARPMALALPHWLTVVLVTLGTSLAVAAEQYLQTVPITAWLSGLSNPKTLVPIALNALVAGVGALIAALLVLLKQWVSTLEVPNTPPPPPPPVQT